MSVERERSAAKLDGGWRVEEKRRTVPVQVGVDVSGYKRRVTEVMKGETSD